MSNVSKKIVNEYKIKVKNLIAQMTVEEKISQLVFDAPAIERLGIKEYNWWSEALHGIARAGVATVFPQAIGLAATFDENLLEKIGDVVSAETRAKYNMHTKYGDRDIYKGLTVWSPNVNIFRDPHWGRGHETYGEDPYLTSRLGVGYINGLQGNDERFLKTSACAKHFAVHSGPEDKRHIFNAISTSPQLEETYLYAFEKCVKEAEVESVMGAYNRVNGEPCCGSKTLLCDILRDKWGFSGHVTSDCWAIRDFYTGHFVVSTPEEAAALAVRNGCDLNCGCTYPYLLEALNKGLITEQEIDVSLERLFLTRAKLGELFETEDNPYINIQYSVVDCKEHRDFNLEVAKRTLVLLKNNGILPLDKNKVKTVGVIGPNANNRKALVGNYEGTASRYITLVEGIQDYLESEGVRVLYSEGCHIYKDRIESPSKPNDRLSEVKAICQESDVIIGCFGLDASLEGEEGDVSNAYASGDKIDLNFPGIQLDIIKTIADSKKQTVLVVTSGSSLDLSYPDANFDAVIQAWYPGAMGGKAVSELIFGDFSPEGKLPLTFYGLDYIPEDFCDYSMKGKTYRYIEKKPLYPFGFGLSYTKFTISGAEFVEENGTKIKCKVKNVGYFDGCETLQVYVKYENSEVKNPQLKKIEKVRLKKGEERQVEIFLDDSSFALFDENGTYKVNEGKYDIYLGFSQPDERSFELLNTRPFKFSYINKKEIIL